MAESYDYIGENAVYHSPDVKAGWQYIQGLGEEEQAALFDAAYHSSSGQAKFSDGHGGYFLLSWENGKSYRITPQE